LARPSPWGTFTSYSLPAFLAHSASGQNEPCYSLRRHGRSTLVSGPAGPAAGSSGSGQTLHFALQEKQRPFSASDHHEVGHRPASQAVISFLALQRPRSDWGRVKWQSTSVDDNLYSHSVARQPHGRSPRGRNRANACGASVFSGAQLRTIRRIRRAWAHSCKACSNWAGSTAAACASTRAGPRAMPPTHANTRRN
jgi:hypothetical protein